MVEFKTVYERKKLAFHEKIALRLVQVHKFLIDGGFVSINERTDLTIFAYICLIVAGVAFAQAYCFALFILGLSQTESIGIGLAWGTVVFNVDRGLFRNKKEKAAQRVIYVAFSTLILSFGVSFLICRGDLEKIVLKENASHNQAIQDNMKKNLEPYEAEASKQREEYAELQREFANSPAIAQLNSQINELNKRYDNNTRGFSDEQLRDRRINRSNINEGIRKAEQARNQQMASQKNALAQSKKILDEAISHRDSMQHLFQAQTAAALAPADLSRPALLTALVRNYFNLSFYHLLAMLGIVILECLPLWVRIKNDDYEIVPILEKIGNAREFEIQDILNSLSGRPAQAAVPPPVKEDFEPIYQDNHQ